jgi:dihydropteroate synthase
LLYGVSRKSFIGKLMSQAGLPHGDDPGARLPGSLAATWHLLQQGVMLHRVHDVAETRQVFALWEGLQAQR